MFDLNSLMQQDECSHFDEGSFAVFVSRYILKCSGYWTGPGSYRRFEHQLIQYSSANTIVKTWLGTAVWLGVGEYMCWSML